MEVNHFWGLDAIYPVSGPDQVLTEWNIFLALQWRKITEPSAISELKIGLYKTSFSGSSGSALRHAGGGVIQLHVAELVDSTDELSFHFIY